MNKPVLHCPFQSDCDVFNTFNQTISISVDTNYFINSNSEKNIYVQIEPNELIYHDWLLHSYDMYDKILCWEENLLSLPNAVLFPFGTCRVDRIRSYTKEFAVSHLYSSKLSLPGQKIRHEVGGVLTKTKIKSLNISSPPMIERKELIFDGFQYSIIIENVSKKNWFTEKLIDCLISNTIPIYYGCTNISEYFDDSYFFKFKNLSELKNIIDNLTPNYYEHHLTKIIKNRDKCFEYVYFWQRINDVLKKSYK